MKPVTPVLLRNPLRLREVVYAKNQPEYMPLPAIQTDDGVITSRWTLTWRERLRVLWTGSVWQQQWMFGHPLTPSMLTTVQPKFTRRGNVLDNEVLTA